MQDFSGKVALYFAIRQFQFCRVQKARSRNAPPTLYFLLSSNDGLNHSKSQNQTNQSLRPLLMAD